MQRPSLGRIVHYRGRHGIQALRCAIVTATTDTLDPRGVDAGAVEALDSPHHAHLWVYTPGPAGGFDEANIPYGPGIDGTPEPGKWAWPLRIEE